MLKKLTICIVLIFFVIGSVATSFAYTFPEPDWAELFYQREDMVMEEEFELYAQADIESAPYYGAKLEPRGGTYIGAIPSNVEKLLPVGSYLTYIDDMNQPDIYYPDNNMIRNDNVIPMVGWVMHNMDNINYGRVRDVLDTLNSYNKPMYIRFANEMNCSNLGDDPDKYVEIFRNVADMVHEYPNFAMVWSPNDIGALNRPFEYYWPGDEYVDWVGVSCYSVKYFQGNQNTTYKDSVYFMSGDYSWATNKIKPIMEFMKNNNINKPVMISEGGVATSNVYGEDCQSWATPRLGNMLWYIIMKYPQVKMINYFDVYREYEKEKFLITKSKYAIDIFNTAKNSGAYITEYGDEPEFVFQPVNNAGVLKAKNGLIKLYTMAYFPEQPDITVNYFIDGVWCHSSNQIPYICNLDVSDISDGEHILKISALGKEKEYVFYKKGNSIQFGGKSDDIENQVSNKVTVTINGKELNFDQPPVIQDSRVLVPMRLIFESLGATVSWNGNSQTVTAVKGNKKVHLTLGSNILHINDREIALDVPAQAINGRTLVPVRAVAESFNCDVDWDQENFTVVIIQ